MSLETLIESRRPVWDRLDRIVSDVYRRGVRRVSNADVHLMIYLYREVSGDLARLRVLQADPQLIARVNRLVARAHGQIYRGTERRSFSVAGFFLKRYPQLVRETWRFTFASFLVSIAFAGIGY